jgi:hypothetical protein
MLFARSEMRLGLTVEHSEQTLFFEPLDGGVLIPENVSVPSKGRHIGASPSRGFSLRREPAIQDVARSHVTCGKQIQALTPTVNLVPMKGERVPWLGPSKGFQKGKSRSYA